jgi:P27 family predicted phage terminase small subunit
MIAPVLVIEPLEKRPEPMHKLDPVALVYFNHCADLLIASKVLTAADVPGMTRAATWYSIFCKALEDVERDGPVQITSTGYGAKSANYSVMTESERILSTWERSVGLNVAGRSKLPPPPAKKDKNPFDEL